MKLRASNAPHIRHSESTRMLMMDAVLSMLFVYGMAFFYYGPRAVVLGLASVAAAVAADLIGRLVAGKRLNPRDLSSVVTGMLIPLFMPASIPYYIPVIAAIFAILVAKHPFGGVGHNVFNPAAAGISFAIVCFPERLFAYPLPSAAQLPVFGPLEEILTVTSPAFTLGLGGIPRYTFVEMILGNFPGPMGATNILVIFACLLYLLFRKAVRWEMPTFFFLTAALFIFTFSRGGAELGLDAAMRSRLMVYELMSGSLMLGGVFLLGDPVTTPKRSGARAAFGAFAAVVVLVFRRYGGFEEPITFAVLILNMSVWGFDMVGERIASRIRLRRVSEQRAKQQ